MQTAILFFIASSVGISVGWQPMPDGSPRYEYVLQLDRDLLATLKQGDSIPISSEVPDDIRPIARIRIVVGDENLPRQKLVTQFKPWPEGQSHEGPLREGLVETQYTVPSDAASQNSGNIAPRYQNQPILPANSSSQQILPPKNRPQSDGNSFGQALRRSAQQAQEASTQVQILPPAKEILPPSQEIPSKEILPPQNSGRYAEPIQSANQKQGNQWHDANASSQADIQQLFGPALGEQGQGYLQPAKEQSIATDDQYSPASRGSDPISPNTKAILPPLRVPSNSPVTSESSVSDAPWPTPKPSKETLLGRENPLTSPPAGNFQSSEWPKTDAPARTTTESQWPSSSPPPEIRREMLSQPANAELRTASGGPASTTRASFPQSTAPLPPQSTVISQPQVNNSPSNSVFPLLLAWVLLSGSGAGNLYLFWSYLDIRNKYRGLVRTAGRKLGRRSEEEEYDE